jgi:membrane-associated HD superfamily phosphohydrolase
VLIRQGINLNDTVSDSMMDMLQNVLTLFMLSSEFYVLFISFNAIHVHIYFTSRFLIAGIVLRTGYQAQEKKLVVITKNCKTQQMNYLSPLMTPDSLTQRWVQVLITLTFFGLCIIVIAEE